MDQGRRKKTYQTPSYIDGTAVRKIQPVRSPQEEQITRRTIKEEPKRKAKPKRSPAIGFLEFVILAGAMALTLFTAVDYLSVQSGNVALKKQITTLQSELTIITNDNNVSLNHINTTLDLEKVFNEAVEDLGMVFPNNNQIITYKSVVSEYVRQYDRIPEVNAWDLLDKIKK